MGVIAVFAGLVALAYTIEGIQDFTNPAVPVRLAILGEFIMSSVAFAALIIGIQLLRFSISGRGERSTGWANPVLDP